MDSMFCLHMLPANHGDCLWIEYGSGAAPHRVLIDGGPSGAWKYLGAKLDAVPRDKRHFELLVCTHVDADHITGVLKILKENEHGARYDDVWFNGFKHISNSVDFAPAQGEALSAILEARPWNKAFGGEVILLPGEGPLMETTLAGGMKLTIMSPTFTKLRKFVPKWRKECIKAGLDPDHPAKLEEAPPLSFATPEELDIEAAANADFKEDRAEANGSSIAFLAEYNGKRVLFGADAHPSVLIEAIERMNPTGGRLKVDAFKLPHHGSQNNVSRELIEKVDAPRYLVSTNGDIFRHPDAEALARVVKFGGGRPELVFNYVSSFNAMWDNPQLTEKFNYRTTYPKAGQVGMIVEL